MKIHDIKLPENICDTLLVYVNTLDTAEEIRGDRGNISPFISKTKGGIKESSTVKDMNLFSDKREYLILRGYENHQESGYTNYTSEVIDALIPENIFSYFKLTRADCRIDIKKSLPGKIHIPHKDYYINYKYNLRDINGNVQYIPKESMKNKQVIRLWITLTEPKFGHILIIENKAFYSLERGTIITWDPEELHTAANLGYENRFIMTITGSTDNNN